MTAALATAAGEPVTAVAAALAELARIRHGLAPKLTLARIGDQVRALGHARATALLAAAREADDWVAFVDRLLVHETYFFRHPAQLEVLAERLAAWRGDGPPRIWCAGCATGEEAWTVALIAHDVGLAARIVATDLSAGAIATARAATYRRNGGLDAFRAIPDARRAHFASVLSGAAAVWTVPDAVRSTVRFARHDLTSPPPVTGVDFVLCRNMMIYLDPPAYAAVEARLAGALRPGGVLLTGPAETPRDLNAFVASGDPGAMIWRRTPAP